MIAHLFCFSYNFFCNLSVGYMNFPLWEIIDLKRRWMDGAVFLWDGGGLGGRRPVRPGAVEGQAAAAGDGAFSGGTGGCPAGDRCGGIPGKGPFSCGRRSRDCSAGGIRGPDVVAAWGNGDILSTAGAMVFFGKKDCPLVLLPTVPGAGEALSGWVTVTHGNLRHTLVDGPCQPAMVLLDPSLYKRCERGILAEAGFSLLSDALESFTARGSGTIASMLARDAFCGTWAALPAASLGNAGAVQRLHMASVTVGMAQPRSGLGLCYAMAGALGSRYRVGMGKLKAILLPEVIGCNAHRVGSRYAELARAAGMGGTTEAAAIRNLRAAVVRLRRELGLPECLAQAGIPPSAVWSDAGALVAGILGDPVLEGNPVAVDDFMIRRILEAATGRR